MKLRLFYAAGPGDVIGTFEHWKAGREDPRELSMTYSGQFYTLCRELQAEALVIAQRKGGRCVREGQITMREQATPFDTTSSALFYHLGQILGGLRLAWLAWRFGADLAIISNGTHWFMLTLLRLMGIRVVPDLHCTLWPTGHPPAKRVRRWVAALNGWFWRHIPSATMCISPECERQVKGISRQSPAGTLLPTRPTYRREMFADIALPHHETRPFALFYAGRIEKDKGVFDLLAVMKHLNLASPGMYRCAFCGTGSALDRLSEAVRAAGLADVVRLCGQLNQNELREELAAAHVVVVPTTASFVEGLNRVAVEAILAHRPAIVTSICPASELISDAAIVVKPGDVPDMCKAVCRLAGDKAYYARLCTACSPLAAQFYDPAHCWGAQAAQAIRIALPAHFQGDQAVGHLA